MRQPVWRVRQTPRRERFSHEQMAELVVHTRVWWWKGKDQQPDDHRQECRRDDYRRPLAHELLKQIVERWEQVGLSPRSLSGAVIVPTCMANSQDLRMEFAGVVLRA
jgi:hypothetical protein